MITMATVKQADRNTPRDSSPCPDCGSTVTDNDTAPSPEPGKEEVKSTCDGCGKQRGSYNRLVSTLHEAELSYGVYHSDKGFGGVCNHGRCGYRFRAPSRDKVEKHMKSHLYSHVLVAKVEERYHFEYDSEPKCNGKRCKMCSDGGVPETQDEHWKRLKDRYGSLYKYADDVADVKQAINRCEAFGSVSMWLAPDGKITVGDWHGGESAVARMIDQGYVRLHWDVNTFIVHYTPPFSAIQGVAIYSLLEAIRMPSVTIMTTGGGVRVDTSGNPRSQMQTIRATNRATVAAMHKHGAVMSAQDFMAKFKVGWTLFGDATTTDRDFPTQYKGMTWARVKNTLAQDKAQMMDLKEDIQRNGVLTPVVVDNATQTVIDGHHRVIACLLVGAYVPYVLVDSEMRPITAMRKQGVVTIPQLEAATTSPEFNRLLADVIGFPGNSATHGGCLLVAQAIQKIFGGELVALVDDMGPEWEAQSIKERGHLWQMVQHYMVEISPGTYLDGDGRHGNELLHGSGWDSYVLIDGKFIPVTPQLLSDNKGIWTSPAAVDRIVDFLREWL